MVYVLIVLMGGGLSSGAVFKVGHYRSEESCKAARAILIDEKTPLHAGYVLCVPIDAPTGG